MEAEIEETGNDLERVLAQYEEIQKQNHDLQDRFASLSQTLATTVGLNADTLLKENNELKTQLSALTSQYNDQLEMRRVSNTNEEEWRKEKENFRMRVDELTNRITELQLITSEDQNRIENLYQECGNLSGKLNDSMELMEKYKTGYINLKRKNEQLEKTRSLEQSVNSLSSTSGSLNCRNMQDS